MALVLAGECSYSGSGVSKNSYEKQDAVDMRDEEDGVCKGSISNLAHYIPLDLTLEILTRLPAKSLKRFQCVSTEWLSTIRNQGFIDSFASLSQTRSRFLVAVRNDENRVFLLSSSHNEKKIPKMPTPGWFVEPIGYSSLDTNLEMTVSSSPVDLIYCSSVHGLFGLLHPSYPGRFTICNPSTRQMVTLPDIKASSTGGLEREHVYLFLGYDPVGHEYKALCSTVLYGAPCQHHRVLTLGRGNLSWRCIKGRKTFRYIVVTKGICINGMVYFGGWMTNKRQEKKARIFQFDVRSERMVSIRTYAPVITRGSLINYYGKLAMFYPYPCSPLSNFDFWVLEDLDKGRWIRTEFNAHPLVSELSGNIQLNMLGMSKTGKIILGPLKLPPKHEPLYIFYYYNEWKGKNFIRRVELEGFEEFGCNHTSNEQCGCQLLISPDHLESLVSL